ncbi:MAG: DUF4956 domain-containing protein [Clostridia bacterium]
MTSGNFFLCLLVALITGIAFALMSSYKSSYTKSFIITLAMIPAVVSLIITMVNGNIGTGIAVAGAFSLVRFRSAPGTAKEICGIFIAMATGLAFGMGYLAYAVIFSVIMGAMVIVFTITKFGERPLNGKEKVLKITIAEDLDYTTIFDDLFATYTDKVTLISVKTVNMGSMIKLHYKLTLKDEKQEKALMDNLRCRNGNLEVMFSRQDLAESDL